MPSQEPPLFSLMENAPWQVVYALHWPYCIYLMIRYRGTTLPSVANPGLDASGLAKESKTELFNLLGPTGQKHLAPFVTVTVGPQMRADAARLMEEKGLAFPVVAKPDIGRNGRGMKIVRSEEELLAHLGKFPEGVKVLIQRYISDKNEAGVFYVRMPSEPRGRVTSLTLKYFPEVVGDGRSTLRELILQDPRARVLAELYFKRNAHNLETVIPAGVSHPIVSVGNHVRGSRFENGARHITPELEAKFDAMAQEMPGFYFGRFDVRYPSLEELKSGERFNILEYNGASSEPIHVWDPTTSVFETYATMLRYWKYVFEIGAENRARGARPMRFIDIARRYLSERALLDTYPDEE